MCRYFSVLPPSPHPFLLTCCITPPPNCIKMLCLPHLLQTGGGSKALWRGQGGETNHGSVGRRRRVGLCMGIFILALPFLLRMKYNESMYSLETWKTVGWHCRDEDVNVNICLFHASFSLFFKAPLSIPIKKRGWPGEADWFISERKKWLIFRDPGFE